MAAPTPGAVGTQRTGSSAAPAFAAPAGVAAGKFVVIAFFIDGGTTITNLNGFSHAPGSPIYNNVNSHSLNIVGAFNPAGSTYTINLSASAYSEGGAIRYDGVDTTTPWDANTGIGTAVAADPTSGTVTPAVSLTTQAADELLVHGVTDWSGGTWTVSSTGGTWTKEIAANVGLVMLEDKAQAVAGPTGAISASCTGNDKRTAWLGALRPAAGGSTATNVADTTSTGVRAGSSPATAAFDMLAAVDTDLGSRSGFSPATVVIGTLAATDAPLGVRAGESSASVALGVVVTDTPSGVRAGSSPGSVAFGTSASDGTSPGGRLGASLTAVLAGMVVLDTPVGVRASSGHESVLIGAAGAVTVVDVPAGLRAGASSANAIVVQSSPLVPVIVHVWRTTVTADVERGAIVAPVKEVRG